MITALDTTLFEVFGFPSFRPGQREALDALFRERRLLCIQPTGHGKSLLYQLPAVQLSGLTVVISPLLSLMRDQVAQLKGRFRIAAAALHSEQTADERTSAIAAAKSGALRILFVSPEQADHAAHRALFASLEVALLVVDEAHCISTWGHDFRPAYRGIVRLVQTLGPETLLLALTATANARVADDIRAQLGDAAVLRHSARRDNLELAVVAAAGLAEKLTHAAVFAAESPGAKLIYCATRDHVETVAAYLVARGVRAAPYHAGYPALERQALERGFIDGSQPCLVATNALGMGIDKPDLRAVLHFDLPGSITAYYQEMGRAGRDGAPARCELLFDAEDARVQEHFIATSQPGRAAFASALEVLHQAGAPLRLGDLKAATGLHGTLLNVVLAELTEQAFVEKIAQGGRQAYVLAATAGNVADLDLGRYERQAAARRRELDAMLAYGRQAGGCLMATLCEALGDVGPAPCGRCAPCRGEAAAILGDTGHSRAWLDGRQAAIGAQSRGGHEAGVAAIDGVGAAKGMAIETQRLLATRDMLAARDLRERFDRAIDALSSLRADAVVLVPSRRWLLRRAHGEYVARRLGAPLVEVLTFATPPAAPQSALANDEQRRRNVAMTMRRYADLPRSAARIVLVDDVVGSGATMREAARALAEGCDRRLQIVPLALLRTRWKNA